MPPANAEQADASVIRPVENIWDRTALRIFAIVALALLLRVLFLGKSFWLDEGVAFIDAWAGGLPITGWRAWFSELWKAEFNMVFYFALLRVWMQTGTSEAYLRILSVVPGVASIPVVYALGKRLFSERVALISALLLAVHGSHIGYSQELRGYTLVVFLSAASTLLLVLGVEENRNRYWISYWIVSALAVYTHFFAGLVVAAQWASLWWAPPRTIPWKKLGISTAAFTLSIVPAVIFVLVNKGRQVDWIPRPGLGQLVNVISEFAGSPSALPLYVALWWFGFRHCARARSTAPSDPRRWHAALVVSWFVLPVLLALVISLNRPMLVPRYLLVCAPASVLLAGIGAAQISIRRSRILVWAAVALSLAFVVVRYARPKEDWRGASEYVFSQSQPGEAVAVIPWWSEAPFGYYKLRSHDTVVTELPSSAVINAASVGELAAKYPRLWLIVYSRPQGLSDPQASASERALANRYALLDQRHFRLIQVRLYGAKP